MYLIKRLLKLLVKTTLLLFLFWSSIRVYFWLTSAEQVALRSEDETRSTVHWLQQDKPLIFNFSSDRTFSIRVLSNAIFNQQNHSDEPVQYAIEYTLLDTHSNPLATHIYHHASKLALDNEEKQVKQIIENRDTLAVSSGQSFFISNEQLTNAKAISLRLIPENIELRGVVVRLHAKTPVSESDINRAWLKQSKDWRERMTNYHTIGDNALSNQEILNAMTFEWQKLAPQGIPGIDFTGDTLYETLPYYVLSYDFSIEQLNLDSFYTDSSLSASFRNYITQNIYVHKEHHDTPLFATWFDIKQLKPPIQLQLMPTEMQGVYAIPAVEPGLIMLQSDKPLLTRWFAQDDTPFGALHSYFYTVSNKQNLIYRVAENSDAKFEFRGKKGTAVEIKLFNDQTEIEAYQIYLQGNISDFDRVIDEATLRKTIFDAEQFYLRLPPNVNRITIHAKQPLLAKLQSRSSTFHYQSELCEQLCQLSLHNFYTIDAWFSQKADNDYKFSEQKMITNVRLFETPPEIPEEETTTYLSRDLIKDLQLSNTFLMNSPDKYYMDDYSQPNPTEYQFNLVTSSQQLSHALKNNQLRDKRVIKLTAKHPHYKEQALTDINEAQILSLFEPESVLYVNDGEKRPWQKQRNYFLKAGQPLALSYTSVPESVVIKVFSTTEFSEHLVINTEIKAQFVSGLSSEYTIPNKRFALMPAKLTKAHVLHPAIKNVASFSSISLAINDDIKTLEHIIITSEQDIWISVLDELNSAPNEAQWRQYEND